MSEPEPREPDAGHAEARAASSRLQRFLDLLAKEVVRRLQKSKGGEPGGNAPRRADGADQSDQGDARPDCSPGR